MNKIKITKSIIIFSIFILLSLFCVQSNINNTNNTKIMVANAVEINLSDNIPLRNYLEDINAGGVFDNECFKNLKVLSFSSAREKSKDILSINGLEQFIWTNLETIEINGLLNLKDVCINGFYNNKTIFPNLKEIVIKNVFTLNNVDLKNNNVETLKIINNPNIDTIIFPNMNVCKNLEISNLNCNTTKLFSPNLKLNNLETLKIIKSSAIENIVFDSTPQLNNILISDLENLRLCKLENAPLLKNLNMLNVKNLESLIISNSPLLKNIKLDENEKEAVEQINKFASKQLKTLVIKNNNHITNLDLANSSNLEILNLDNCSQLKSLLLNKNISSLSTLSLSNLSLFNSNLDLSTCKNLQVLNLYKCNLLKDGFFNQIENLKTLEFLNLEKSSITNINIVDFPYLHTLKIGNYNNLETINLQNINILEELDISNCNRLKTLIIKDLPKLNKCQILNSSVIETININNTNVSSLEFVSYSCLTEINLSLNKNLKELLIIDCPIISNILFCDSVNLEKINFSSCYNLEPDALKQLENMTKLNRVTFEDCPTIDNLCIKNCNNMEFIDIKNMPSLVGIKLNNINKSLVPFELLLPKEYKRLKFLELIDLYNVNIENSQLICNNGILQKVILKNLPLEKIDIANNRIVTLSIRDINALQKINIANNKISDFPKLIDELDALDYLSYANLNGNRIDFNEDINLKLYNRSKSKNLLVIGVQNIINKNNYTYYPKLYIGNFEANIKLVIYHTGNKIRNPNVNKIDTNNFYEVAYEQFAPFTLDTGTYIFKYYKIDSSNLENIVQGDEYYNNYTSLYCNVTKNRPWISYVWIIFFCLAGGVIIFIIASFIYDKFKIRKSKTKNDFGETDSDLTEDFISDKQLEKENIEKKELKIDIENLTVNGVNKNLNNDNNSKTDQIQEEQNIVNNYNAKNIQLTPKTNTTLFNKSTSINSPLSPRKTPPKPPIIPKPPKK